MEPVTQDGNQVAGMFTPDADLDARRGVIEIAGKLAGSTENRRPQIAVGSGELGLPEKVGTDFGLNYGAICNFTSGA